MDASLNSFSSYADQTLWLFPLLILLAGLNVPISIDILILTAGGLAATQIPDQSVLLFFVLWLACIVAAWEAYGLGRFFGPKIVQLPLMHSVISLKKIEQLHIYYERFGIWTFLIGRFIPGGVRNALFISSGMGKMPFGKFLLRDVPACTLSVVFLYFVGYAMGKNVDEAIAYFKQYQTVTALLLCGGGVLIFLYWAFPRKKKRVL